MSTREQLEREGWKVASVTGGDHLRRMVAMYEELGIEIRLEEISSEECSGCRECYDTGFQGRTGIYEILTITPTLRRIVARDADLEQIRELHRQEGGTFLLDEGIRLAEAGHTSLEEIVRLTFTD